MGILLLKSETDFAVAFYVCFRWYKCETDDHETEHSSTIGESINSVLDDICMQVPPLCSSDNDMRLLSLYCEWCCGTIRIPHELSHHLTDERVRDEITALIMTPTSTEKGTNEHVKRVTQTKVMRFPTSIKFCLIRMRYCPSSYIFEISRKLFMPSFHSSPCRISRY